MSGTRNKNVRPDELQALLQACIDVGVEAARQDVGRTGHLFYDVQQRMSHYGDFPERKLYRLQKYYYRVQREFLAGKLDPYPPEARVLWGKAEHADADDPDNDDRWSALIESTVKRKQCHSYVSYEELREIITLARQTNVENLPIDTHDYVFEKMVSMLKEKKMFLNRNAAMLKQVYFRLRKRFLKGKTADFPPEAAKLWASETEGEVGIKFEIVCSDNESESLSQVFDLEISAEVPETAVDSHNVCRICQAQPLSDCKDLLQDTYNSQTYGEIIQETIQVQILCDGQISSKICLECSKFVESMLIFVQQCREACNISSSLKFDACFVEEDYMAEQGADHTADTAVEYLIEKVEPEIDENSLNEQQSPAPADDFFKAEPEAIPDCTEQTMSDQQKYSEFIQSRPSKHRQKKKQCHFCGKSVRDLAIHLTRHGEAKLQCEFCPRKFPNSNQLRVHVNTHTKKYSYPCRVGSCDRVFYNWTTRKNHEQTHDSKFNCKECDASYAYKSQLSIHVRQKHKGIRHLACPHCSFRTFIKSRLLNHVRSIHTSERPYRCTYCESTSNSSTGYYIHFQRHKKSGEAKEYSILCAYCGLQFSKDVALETHICQEHPDVAVVI
ncbi:zinc finger protein 449-like [Sabethes cyaneus]|uniref:zinc finger protein 449-like n=1 Tax=Sabethes cyaneus TaxID=53552 RepID=UPI00237DCFA2|nr:zinc finger protein 449-like [Sabethes cyaneus]